MGIAVIGGLTIGSALALYVIPAVYVVAAPKRARMGGKNPAAISGETAGEMLAPAAH